MHVAPYCGHGYVLLRFGGGVSGGGDIIMRNGEGECHYENGNTTTDSGFMQVGP